MDFSVPGFLLMQQALENLIKACLRMEGISWILNNGKYGSDGHSFKKLIKLGSNIDFLEKISSRSDLMNVLEQLGRGYNLQRYGESGHFIYSHEAMMDSFDEIAFILVKGYSGLLITDSRDLKIKELLPVPKLMFEIFSRNLKMPFTVIESGPFQ